METVETGGMFVLALGLVEVIKALVNKRKAGNGVQPVAPIAPIAPDNIDDKQDIKLCDEKHLHINEKLTEISADVKSIMRGDTSG